MRLSFPLLGILLAGSAACPDAITGPCTPDSIAFRGPDHDPRGICDRGRRRQDDDSSRAPRDLYATNKFESDITTTIYDREQDVAVGGDKSVLVFHVATAGSE